MSEAHTTCTLHHGVSKCLWTGEEGNFEIRTSSQVPKGLPGFEPSSFWLEGCATYRAPGNFAEVLNVVCRQRFIMHQATKSLLYVS